MRYCSIVLVCAALLVMAGCRRADQRSVGSLTERAPLRASRTASKGMELYSWKSADGQWTFGLLLGTNRRKSLSEITNPRETIVGIDRLKDKLSALAVGESVPWTDVGNAIKSQRSPASVSIESNPVPKSMINELTSYCRGLDIELTYTPGWAGVIDPTRSSHPQKSGK